MEKGGEMPDSESEWRDERISEFKYLRTSKLKVPEHVRTSKCFRPEGRTRRLKPFLVPLPFATILFVHHASTWIAKSGSFPDIAVKWIPEVLTGLRNDQVYVDG